MRIEHRILKSFGLILGLFLVGGLGAFAGELDINLVRNSSFRPGMDQQGPVDWIFYAPRTNIYEAGRGRVTFTENGMTLEGPSDLFQFDMWDDVTPAYKFTCHMKSEGGKGAYISMRIRNRKTGVCRDSSLGNRELNVWEDLALDINPSNHYGFCMEIDVPAGVKLSISSLRVTAALKPEEMGSAQIADAGSSIPARGILLPGDPNWAEQLAAHELQVNVYLVSGAVLPVFAGGGAANEKGYIRVASLKKTIPDNPVPREEKKRPAQEPQANGFRITCANGNVEVTGGNDAGVLAGAMHLSELLGAKFYAPRVYSIAANRPLKIPAMDIAKQAAFELTTGPDDQNQTFMAWKYGYLHDESSVAPCDKASPPSPGWVHPPLFLAPPFLYGKTNPDFYAQINGKRIEGFNTAWAYLNLCLGNPELQKTIAERIGRLMDMYPQCKYFSITQGDGVQWCECDKCRALDVDKNSWTDRLISYANAVAALLQEKHPDRKLLIYAYGPKTEGLPLKAKLHHNVVVMYAFWPSSWPVWMATVCEQNKRGLKLLDDWNAFTGTNLMLSLYPVNTYENADKLKLAAAKGVLGFNHCGLRGDFPEVTLYTTGRLIWDPEADVEKMITEFMPHMFGAAAPFMHSYFDMHHRFLREMVANPEKMRKYSEKYRDRIKRMPLDYAEKALDLMNKSEKAADNDEYMLMKIHSEKYRILYAYINELQTVYPEIPDDQFADYALKMAELVQLARKCRETLAGDAYYNEPFSEWLFNATGVLDFARGPSWFNDKKIDLFLADPVKTLKTRVYFQEKITNGWELPPKALLGGDRSRLKSKYMGHPAVTIRRNSSSAPRIKAYLRLDALPEKGVELQVQGLDAHFKGKAEISIKINANKIFAGPVDFPDNDWSWCKYKIPREYLKKGENIIMIENITKDYKKEMAGQTGQAGPAEEALAQNDGWGSCMISSIKLMGLP